MNIRNVQHSAVYWWYTVWISLAGALSKSTPELEPPHPKAKFRENKQVLYT
jgi:hypothetical protein